MAFEVGDDERRVNAGPAVPTAGAVEQHLQRDPIGVLLRRKPRVDGGRQIEQSLVGELPGDGLDERGPQRAGGERSIRIEWRAVDVLARRQHEVVVTRDADGDRHTGGRCVDAAAGPVDGVRFERPVEDALHRVGDLGVDCLARGGARSGVRG